MSYFDDDHAIELEARRVILLQAHQALDAELTSMRPERRLTAAEQRMYRKEHAEVVRRRERVMTEYRKIKRDLIEHRRQLTAAAHDVERDLTNPGDLIEELYRLAVRAHVWEQPGGQVVLDAARSWLGPRAVVAREQR